MWDFPSSLMFSVILVSMLAAADTLADNATIGIPPAPKPKTTLKLLLANDDGWAETNIRMLYQEIKAQGDFPIISAPTKDRSATGPKRKDKIKNLKGPAEYDSVPAGAPGYGCDPEDAHICYVNGYPIDAMDYGIRNLSSVYFGGPPDLALSGPNVGANIGPQAWFSGTYNAARWAAQHDIPAIATSVYGDKNRHFYRNVTASDPSHIYAKVVVRLVNVLTSEGKKAPFLPPHILLNVNLQKAGPKENCKAPEDYKFVLTSQYGHSTLKFWKSRLDVHRCGASALPSEHHIMDQEHGCWASITVRMADDDVRVNRAEQQMVVDLLGDLLTCP